MEKSEGNRLLGELKTPYHQDNQQFFFNFTDNSQLWLLLSVSYVDSWLIKLLLVNNRFIINNSEGHPGCCSCKWWEMFTTTSV